jgi:hypothetical protein
VVGELEGIRRRSVTGSIRLRARAEGWLAGWLAGWLIGISSGYRFDMVAAVRGLAREQLGAGHARGS